MKNDTLKDICFEYYQCWQGMERLKKMAGDYIPYSSRNYERIELHEQLLEISGLQREDLEHLTNNLNEMKSKTHFYNEVLKKIQEVKNASQNKN